MYDLIGDIHGHAGSLKLLLSKLGYEEKDGVWQHPERKAIFIGDYIDRGPAIRATLQIVRSMVENEKAIALMGNHEYNALAFIYPDGKGDFLRAHNALHRKQHQATLEQFAPYKEEWQWYLEWFRTLPLFLELPGLRAVHACWDDAHIQWLKERNHYTISDELLVASHQEGTPAYEVIVDTLKGKEMTIPEEWAWPDKEGHMRTENRIKWWVLPHGKTYGDFLFNCPTELHKKMIEEDIKCVIYPQDAPPVFVGHYWLSDLQPSLQAHNVACLDYSIAKEGRLAAYRWDGEQVLSNENFVSVAYDQPS